jgi:hypothetical protein
MWQLYNHFPLFADAVRPLVELLYRPFAAFFNWVNVMLLHFTQFWIVIFRPFQVLLTGLFTALSTLASPIITVLYRTQTVLANLYQPLISCVGPLVSSITLLFTSCYVGFYSLFASCFANFSRIFTTLSQVYTECGRTFVAIWQSLPSCTFCNDGAAAFIMGIITMFTGKISLSVSRIFAAVSETWRRINQLNLSETKHLRDMFKNNLKTVINGVSMVVSPVLKKEKPSKSPHLSPMPSTTEPSDLSDSSDNETDKLNNSNSNNNNNSNNNHPNKGVGGVAMGLRRRRPRVAKQKQKKKSPPLPGRGHRRSPRLQRKPRKHTHKVREMSTRKRIATELQDLSDEEANLEHEFTALKSPEFPQQTIFSTLTTGTDTTGYPQGLMFDLPRRQSDRPRYLSPPTEPGIQKKRYAQSAMVSRVVRKRKYVEKAPLYPHKQRNPPAQRRIRTRSVTDKTTTSNK